MGDRVIRFWRVDGGWNSFSIHPAFEPPDEHPWIEQDGFTPSYRTFRQRESGTAQKKLCAFDQRSANIDRYCNKKQRNSGGIGRFVDREEEHCIVEGAERGEPGAVSGAVP